MNRADIIRLAKKAGLQGMATDVVCQFAELEHFAALIAAAELEHFATLIAAAQPVEEEPMQQIVLDRSGVFRFKENRIISTLLEISQAHGYSLNEIGLGEYTPQERMQFVQLIGHSVKGYHSLPFVSDASCAHAEAAMARMHGAVPAPQPVAWMRDDEMKAMTDDEKQAWIAAGRKEVVAEYTKPLMHAHAHAQPVEAQPTGPLDLNIRRAI